MVGLELSFWACLRWWLRVWSFGAVRQVTMTSLKANAFISLLPVMKLLRTSRPLRLLSGQHRLPLTQINRCRRSLLRRTTFGCSPWRQCSPLIWGAIFTHLGRWNFVEGLRMQPV